MQVSERRRGIDRLMYLHVQQIGYRVPCPVCVILGLAPTCDVCRGLGEIGFFRAEKYWREHEGRER